MIDRKNFILISVVLLVVGITGLYIPYLQYQKGQENLKNKPATINNGTVITILYTNKGFEPNSVTVKVGTTVEWINTSDKLMWVASDPHPSHNDLPGFDERGVEGNVEAGVQGFITRAYAHTGQTEYRYTFQKAGKWKYHNHLSPGDRGVVVVE